MSATCVNNPQRRNKVHCNKWTFPSIFYVSTIIVLKINTFLSHPILHPTSSILIQHPTSNIQHPISYILNPASHILHPASYIQHPTSYSQHPTSSIQLKKYIQSNPTLSNPIIHKMYPIQQNYLRLNSRNENTMRTSDIIVYFLGHLCNKERAYTNWLFSVSSKLILSFFAGLDRIW